MPKSTRPVRPNDEEPDIAYEDGVIVVRIPCTTEDIKKAPMSKGTEKRPGRNKLIASTRGFRQVRGAPEGIQIAVNVIAWPELGDK